MNRFPNFERFLKDEGLTWEIKNWTTELYYSVQMPASTSSFSCLEASRLQKAEAIPFHELVSVIYPIGAFIGGPTDVENLYLIWRLEHGV